MTTLVRDQMITSPKTLPARASVEEARSALADSHVHLLLLTEGRTLRGTLTRTDLPATAAGDSPALTWSTLVGRTTAPDVPADPLRDALVHTGLRRLAVVDAELTLLGLLCLKRSGAGFCSDADVASRALAADQLSRGARCRTA
ncbi:hypothetical protein GCM10011376_09880 [Nocardioides flavus (ex Wang et al. 2016)]|uniref:CBS domain-containing protein n=1 Tax=Nocardioides flavus (ex Wang et al. 2016) TaxID=2058780 RepID=A0ABQ3HFK1_9ACTN|nr:CBS domain-containing protein [Nocardioides flavus (ex Wang et al. 2016)]GHE16378.1 hypothetical protein GCM10011376_09880 [Nocardioides flavus (ex Wang et al. 2016)]